MAGRDETDIKTSMCNGVLGVLIETCLEADGGGNERVLRLMELGQRNFTGVVTLG